MKYGGTDATKGWKYTESGTIEFGYSLKAQLIEFYVKDTGIGIPKDRQNAIFERFVQADVSDKQARQGAGLGLSISKAYIEMLGGTIWVESKEGKGSAFYFTLPSNTEQITEKDKHPEGIIEYKENQLNMATGLKILIAEDDEFSYTLLKIMLQGISREILHAGTGLEAVNLARRNPDIDLILMDIKMPGMSGYEATQEIRTFNKDIVIVAQTAFVMRGDKEKALKAGCNAYLAKPIKEEELQSIMTKYFIN